MRFGLLSVLVIGIVVVATTTGGAVGPAVGKAAPDFELKDAAGTAVKLSAVRADGPVVLVVLRGFPGYQCPLCSKQVNDFVAKADDFQKVGAKVLFVYPGSADKLADRAEEFLGARKLPAHFTLLLDPDYGFTNAYELRWDAKNETAYPSTFVIDKAGQVVFAEVSKTHGGRVTAEKAVKAVPAK